MRARLLTNEMEISHCLQGPPGAPVIVFVNGIGMTLSMWAPQVEAFGARYRTLRYDLRGHGHSSLPAGDYSLEMLATDIVALLDGLDVDAAHLIGTSLGAMIGMQLAVSQPGRLLSLTLVATTVGPPQDGWEERIRLVRREGLRSQAKSIVDRWFTPSFHAARPDAAQHMRDMVGETTIEGYVRCAAAIRDMDIADRLGEILIPTLVVAGEDDLVTPIADQDHIAGLIPGAELVPIASAAHMPTIEQPEACNAAIAAFLARCATGAVEPDGTAHGEFG